MTRPIKINQLILDLPYAKGVADVYLSAYQDNQTPALLLTVHDTEEPLLTATSNLSGYGVAPLDRCAFIKDYSENKGILEALLAGGLVEATGRIVKTALVDFPEVKILVSDDVWNEFRKRFPKRH